MVGGRNFEKQQYNVAVQGRRQPGSAFKPFVLATALGEGVSPEKSFPAGPRSFRVGDQTWRVSGSSAGKMRLRKATEKSVNSVFAQLILDVGPEDVVTTAEKMGVRKGIEPVPAIALGGLTEGVSPLEMARAYATLATGGRRPTPYGIARVARGRWRSPWQGQGEARARARSGGRVPHDRHPHRRDQARYRDRSTDRPACRRQDRHHAAVPRRVVRGVHARPGGGRLGRIPGCPARDDLGART